METSDALLYHTHTHTQSERIMRFICARARARVVSTPHCHAPEHRITLAISDTLLQAARLHSLVVFVKDLDGSVPVVKGDATSLEDRSGLHRRANGRQFALREHSVSATCIHIRSDK